jgi:hypothetical protein
MAKKSRARRKPGDELTIEQLEAVARYCGYSLIHSPLIQTCLYDCRSSKIVKRGDRALDHLRNLYTERATCDPDIAAAGAA